MQSYEFYWESGLLSENVNKILFHFLVNVAITGESLAALFVAGECSDKIGVFDLLVDVADKCTSSKVAACNLVDSSLFLIAGSGIQHSNNTGDTASGKNFLDGIVVFLRADEGQKQPQSPDCAASSATG